MHILTKKLIAIFLKITKKKMPIYLKAGNIIIMKV